MRVASFFSGIGGFDLGFEQAGAEVVFQCEIDPHCRMVLQQHWPGVPLHDDIQTLNPKEIPHAEIWCAGWPCQDVSNGNVQRLGLEGERSGLFYQFMDLVRNARTKPKWLILENVIGLLSANKGQAFESVIDEIEAVGYLGGWTTANTLDFGLPQDRKRIVIIASLGTDCAHKVIAHGCKLQGDNPARGKERTRSAAENAASIGGNDALVFQRRGGFGYTRGSRVCPTLRSQSGKHQGGHSDRPILCGEKFDMDRMGAPNGVSGRLDGRRGRLIGNAVAVPMVRWFAETIFAIERGLLDDFEKCEQNALVG